MDDTIRYGCECVWIDGQPVCPEHGELVVWSDEPVIVETGGES